MKMNEQSSKNVSDKSSDALVALVPSPTKLLSGYIYIYIHVVYGMKHSSMVFGAQGSCRASLEH